MAEKKKKKKEHWDFWYFKIGKPLSSLLTKSHDLHVFHEDTKDLKPPFIALGNHQGFYDWAYAGQALLPHRIRFVLTRYQLFRPVLGQIIVRAGSIPKSQFASDPAAMRQVLRTIRQGGAVMMYPSGRLSLFGEDAKPFKGTYELLKKMNVPVVMVHLDGSYRTGPRYNSDIKKSGRVDVHTRILFTPEELQRLSEEEGKERLNAAFCHDDFDSPNQGEYKSRNLIAGLEDLLYLCPCCKSDFTMQTEGTSILNCNKCGFRASMDSRFRIQGMNGYAAPETISAWGRLIIAEETARMEANPDYSLQAEMKLCEHTKRSEMLSPVGTVQARYDSSGFHLKGQRHGQPFERFYSCEAYPALHFLDKIYIIVPENERVMCVSPPTAAEVTKWAVVSEVFAKAAGQGNT